MWCQQHLHQAPTSGATSPRTMALQPPALGREANACGARRLRLTDRTAKTDLIRPEHRQVGPSPPQLWRIIFYLAALLYLTIYYIVLVLVIFIIQ